MRILVDQYIPYLQGVMDAYAQVDFLAPEAFTPQRVASADALIIRTRTHCNKELLAGSSVQYIATATIGFDHIDAAYCAQHKDATGQERPIQWSSCAGCNAPAVCDYVAEVLSTLSPTPHATLGIVGYGHVGRLVAQMAQQRGYHVLVNDPPLGIGVSLSELVAASDIITFHTPLTQDGKYKTYHLCDASLLRNCRPNTLIINAARGGIIDEIELLRLLEVRPDLRLAIDCWENEPQLNTAFLQHPALRLASYHIAGYSVQGKRKASQMCVDALSAHFHWPHVTIAADDGVRGDSAPGWLQRITQQLKQQPEQFEQLRKQYILR